MCGITGFLDLARDKSGEQLLAVLQRMTDTLRHRGPDDAGAWVDAQAGIALGHRRLSILDLSPKGHQPMFSACERYVIVFNGEVYNFRALRKELESLGETFQGHSDTEVMLSAIRQWGVEKAVRSFVGMFAFALWDRKEHILYLVRDRLGKKPLYYGWAGHCFLFGSELKALRAHPAFAAEINRDALALYMRLKYVPAPYSIYQGFFKLQQGTILTLRCAGGESLPQPVPYWSAKEMAERGVASPFQGSEEQVLAQLDALLRDAVRVRLESDVPLGVFLSGGIDSSLVTALMKVQSTQPVKTFTIGFYEAGYDEAPDAKAVAQHLQTEHTELYLTPEETRAVIPRLPTLYDEPFADSSQIPTFLVSQMARQYVTVTLSGDGGDELFGGYDRYHWLRTIWNKIGWMPRGTRRALARTIKAVSPRRWQNLFDALNPVLPSSLKRGQPGQRLHTLAGILPEEVDALYRALISDWQQPTQVVVGAGEPTTPLTDPAQWAKVDHVTHWMMFLDTITYLPDDILVKVDRASMGVSLEARAPLLDHRVVEFAWTLPLTLKVRQGRGKWLLRQLLYRYVPRELIERPKMGFGAPIGDWLRGPLRDWAESLLDERRLKTEGYLQPEPIREKWQEHLSTQQNWQHHLWDALMFQAWLEENK